MSSPSGSETATARASQRLVGAIAALPLAATIFRALEPGTTPAWPAASDEMNEVDLCALTGLPAAEWCPKRESRALPACLFLNRRCDVHYPRPDGGGVVERWPGDARQWDLASVSQPVTVSPDGPGATVTRKQELRIMTPAAESRFIHTGEQGGDKLLLQSSLDGLAPVHWYLDDRFLGTSTPETPLYLTLEPGEHRLTCLTGEGTTDAVNFEVLAGAEATEARPS
jgi:membrane carboxypeptidase/penicillin-binding protein PbpC